MTVRMMGVETRERSERWNERNVLETRRLEGEIESLRTQLSDREGLGGTWLGVMQS